MNSIARQDWLAEVIFAMMDEDAWREPMDNAIDAQTETVDWFEDECHECTEELISYIEDVEFWRHGGN